MVAHSSFTAAQIQSIDIVSRVSSCLSLAGTLFTVTSYTFYPALRKPFNRLAFCIAVANAFGCLAYSWGIHPISHGRTSAFCQTQAFFIQWFVMTDPLLVLTMALSVWLRVQARRSAHEIRWFENIGVLLAFFLPLPPALVFLGWRPNGYSVYGPATLWCWISNQSNILRIAAFYGPVWAMIVCSLALFALSGRRILQIRAQVSRVQAICEPDRPERDGKLSISSIRHFSFAKPGLRVETHTSSQLSNSSNCRRDDVADLISPLPELNRPDCTGTSRLTLTDSADLESETHASPARIPTATGTTQRGMHGSVDSPPLDLHRRRSVRFDTMHWKYARFAFLCTLVLFITWVPISINRIYNNFIQPSKPLYGLYFAGAMCIPLHGFGNFVIYVNTSWPECKAWVQSWFGGCGWRRGRARARGESGRVRLGSTVAVG